MEITDVRIYPVGEEKLQAFVSVVLDHCFRITDIKIIQGSNGRFLSMPSKRRKDGTYRDIAHPLNSRTRHILEEAIFSRFDAMIDSAGDAAAEGLPDAMTGSSEAETSPHGLAAEAGGAGGLMT